MMLKAQTVQQQLYAADLSAYADVMKALATQSVGVLQAIASMVAGVA